MAEYAFAIPPYACSWFETRRVARTPHHEGLRPHPEEARSAVSKDEATELENVLDVICEEEATKQAIVTVAPAVDCFAEPVIGRAFARPVGSQAL
jgi:hypothetical protein